MTKAYIKVFIKGIHKSLFQLQNSISTGKVHIIWKIPFELEKSISIGKVHFNWKSPFELDYKQIKKKILCHSIKMLNLSLITKNRNISSYESMPKDKLLKKLLFVIFSSLSFFRSFLYLVKKSKNFFIVILVSCNF